MTDEAQESLRRLKKGLAHHDSFTPQADDQPVFIYGTDDVLYELPYETGQFALGDLRNLLTLLDS